MIFERSIAVGGTRRAFRLSSGRELQTTPVFDLYWHFAVERQEIFLRRVHGAPPPWTVDPVLRAYRFTNPYRAADRVSQYLIKHVIYEGDQSVPEVFFRTLLFKLYNRIETWERLREQLGILSWESFDLYRYAAVLDRIMNDGATVYSSAYIMPSPCLGGNKKHMNHLLLLSQMMKERVPDRISSAGSLEKVYSILRSVPSLGPFLAFQFAIDLNYSEIISFSEMDFVVAGPGARSGIRKAFVDLEGLEEEDVIREVTDAADREFQNRDLQFRDLWGRPLQLIDCQNLFCEIDKYARAALPMIEGSGRTRIKRRYSTTVQSYRGCPQWYPPKWKLSPPVRLGSAQPLDVRRHANA